jgi:CRISPR-associated exonuclease Cas4
MYKEEELLPISALQHLLFCERRAALIILEGLWQDNVFTAEGSILHEQTHQIETERHGDLRIARGLWLRSFRLGLIGNSDVIEFQKVSDYQKDKMTVSLYDIEGFWQPFPVEYKRGRLRSEESFEVQLCAQALCMEEMLNIYIPAGAIYYGKSKRRLEISFNQAIRNKTEASAKCLHEIVSSGVTPKAHNQIKCQSCSLIDICLPKAMLPNRDVNRYLDEAIAKGGTNQ